MSDFFEAIEAATGCVVAGLDGGGPVVQAVLLLILCLPDGLHGLISAFARTGLQARTKSWVAAGPNAPVTPAEGRLALGEALIAGVAARLGVGGDEAAGHLAVFLPPVVDRLTPHGVIPGDGAVGALRALALPAQ